MFSSQKPITITAAEMEVERNETLFLASLCFLNLPYFFSQLHLIGSTFNIILSHLKFLRLKQQLTEYIYITC